MKSKSLFFIYILIAALAVSCKAQKTTAGELKSSFYVRVVHSGGAYPSDIVNIDGTTVSTQKNPTYEYLLFLEIPVGKKLTISSVEIDKIKYNSQMSEISTPVKLNTFEENGRTELVAKTKNKVYQLNSLVAQSPVAEKGIKHMVTVKGFVGKKVFTASSYAKALLPATAQ